MKSGTRLTQTMRFVSEPEQTHACVFPITDGMLIGTVIVCDCEQQYILTRIGQHLGTYNWENYNA